ncbi:MAG: mannose-1-phosphate guanylyltransferase [Prevotella sp.]|nr:mannose-1-phosphate guanylyltransferase [Prevotella sp.]
MEKNQQHYCIILAGGRGRRLWPYSRDKQPKQFIDFFGAGRTQLQSTFDRFSRLMPQENIIVCTNQEYAPLVHEQLPELSAQNLMVEPVNRNTTASVIWATLNIQKRCPDACIAVTPSDQFVLNDEAFSHNMLDGLSLVGEQDIVLAMGVKPSRPEPGYGYIQMGDASPRPDVYCVQSFTEKPEREFAQMFVESGEFLWNTGLILASATSLRHCVRRIYARLFSAALPEEHGYSVDWVMDYINRNYSSLPNAPIDSSILELCDAVYVMQCDFGWADLGTWHSIYECMSKTEGDNVVVDSEVITEDCHNNVIKLPKDHLAVINGLDGYIVAEKGNVLLICPKGDSSALIRKYVNEVHMRYGDTFI